MKEESRLFDPTIFDNLKVVIEGAVYDQDLEGKWKVIDRSDLVDLATMSREYSIQFQLSKSSQSSCRWILSSTANQLVNELTGQENRAFLGCSTEVEFTISITRERVERVYEIISTIWGERKLLSKMIEPYPKGNDSKLIVSIEFNRVIYEEDVDDLLTMLSYMERTLKELHQKGY
jgi:hypothetical protein